MWSSAGVILFRCSEESYSRSMRSPNRTIRSRSFTTFAWESSKGVSLGSEDATKPVTNDHRCNSKVLPILVKAGTPFLTGLSLFGGYSSRKCLKTNDLDQKVFTTAYDRWLSPISTKNGDRAQETHG